MLRAFDFLHPSIGEMPMYDKEAGVSTFVVGEGGENIVVITSPRRVFIPHWPLEARAPIRPSMPDSAITQTGAVLCAGIAKRMTERVHAIAAAAEAEYPVGGNGDIVNDGDYMVVIPVLQTPVVYFGPDEIGSKGYELIVEVVLGIAAMPVNPDAPIYRVAVDQLPAEKAAEDDFLVPVEDDWHSYEGQDAHAGKLRRAALKGLFGRA